MSRIGVLTVALLAVAPPVRAQETVTMEESIRTALIRNPSIVRAEAGAATAAAERWSDWGAFLPSASLSASLSSSSSRTVTFLESDGSRTRLDEPRDIDSKGNSAGLSLGFNLSAEDFAELDAGGERRRAAEYRLDGSQRLVIRQVKVAYFEALKAQRLVQVAGRQVEARQEDYEVTEDKYRIAAASRSDLLAAEIELRNAELALLDAEDGYDAALRAIRVAQGVPDMSVEGLELVEPGDAPPAEALDADRLVQAAVSLNPDLLALAADESAASAALWSARASYLPTLNASMGFNRGINLGPDESLFTFNPANTGRSVSVSLSLPIFNGFQRKTRNASASNQLAAARASLAEQRLIVEQDVRRLVADIQRGALRLAVLERNAELARERLDLTREQYRLGSVQYINLQQAIESIDAAERAAFDQRYELLKRWAELEERVGDAAL